MSIDDAKMPTSTRHGKRRLALATVMIVVLCIGATAAWILTRNQGVAFACETFSGERRFTVSTDSSDANISNAVDAFDLASKVFDVVVRQAEPRRATSIISINTNCTQDSDGTWKVNIDYTYYTIPSPGMMANRAAGLIVEINQIDRVIRFLSWNR